MKTYAQAVVIVFCNCTKTSESPLNSFMKIIEKMISYPRIKARITPATQKVIEQEIIQPRSIGPPDLIPIISEKSYEVGATGSSSGSIVRELVQGARQGARHGSSSGSSVGGELNLAPAEDGD